MSMICGLVGLSSAQIVTLRQAPARANDLARVAEADSAKKETLDGYMSRMTPEQRARFEAMNKQAEAELAEPRARLTGLGPLEKAISLEKSWHILHYLFTGHFDGANAPGNLLLGGAEVGEDMGYGPARLHDEKATHDFGHFLEVQDLGRLQARIKLREMEAQHIYGLPSGPDPIADYERELRDEVAVYFPMLRGYVAEMVGKKCGLLTWLA